MSPSSKRLRENRNRMADSFVFRHIADNTPTRTRWKVSPGHGLVWGREAAHFRTVSIQRAGDRCEKTADAQRNRRPRVETVVRGAAVLGLKNRAQRSFSGIMVGDSGWTSDIEHPAEEDDAARRSEEGC
jgi:hypothetical protein